MTRKQKESVARGVEHYCAKLTPYKALAIVTRYRQGGITQRELGRRFGVNQSSIRQILTGRSWAKATGIKCQK